MTVTDFENPDGATYVRWRTSGKPIEKRYLRTAFAVELASGTGVLVVEPDGYPDNAVIYDEDGSERVRLRNPDPQSGQSAFVDAYYINRELAVILGTRAGQIACVFDEAGNLVRTYESR